MKTPTDWLATLLILAAFSDPATGQAPAAASPERHPEAVEVFYCDFAEENADGFSWDVNFDGWPDKWMRLNGPGLPHYVPVGICDDGQAPGGKCLQVRMNGGGVQIQGPAVAVSPRFSYKLEAAVRIEGVRHARTRLVLEYCDEGRETLQSIASPWLRQTDGWQSVPIGPTSPDDQRVAVARMVLEVEAGAEADLTGTVSLADVWLGRLPKMVVSTNRRCNVYDDSSEIEIHCALSGILKKNPEILFEVFDAGAHRVQGDSFRLEGRLISERLSRGADIVASRKAAPAGFEGQTSWRPPIPEPGYYRVRVTMRNSVGMLDSKTITFAVVPPLDRSPVGEFGWSLADGRMPLGLDHLRMLLPHAAVSWVKLPVWYGLEDGARGDQIAMFAEQMAASNVEIVGVLDKPPANSELGRQLGDAPQIADALAHDDAWWLPTLDDVMTRLALRVRWWQLGSDTDKSFAASPRVDEEILRLRSKLFRFGQDVKLGICWDWADFAAHGGKSTWEFQQLSATPPLTGDELAAYLDLPKRPGVGRWVAIEPLPRERYDLAARARDLVQQVLAAKIGKAEAIFAVAPFDDDRGLMHADGSPSELFLPWRTAASLLSGASSLGSLTLPQRSPNRVFQTPDGDVVMVVWADEPVRETFYFGDDVRVVDVWGRSATPDSSQNQQIVDLDRMPLFIRGLHPEITAWRTQVQFAEKHVPSEFGRTHPVTIRFVNTFRQGVGGTVRVVPPEAWQAVPESLEFKLAEHGQFERSVELALPFDASTGPAKFRLDFEVIAERKRKFSVYRELSVGDGDIEVDLTTRLEKNGDLVVEQRMTNHAAELVDFKCLLYASGRRRQRLQVFQLGSGNPDVKIYRYPDGQELLGAEIWLRAEEVDGRRVLNYRTVVEQ